MELFHPAKGFEITFHINFGSFCENPVQDVTIFVAQTAQNCSNQSVNWVAWNILPFADQIVNIELFMTEAS